MKLKLHVIMKLKLHDYIISLSNYKVIQKAIM